MPFAQLGNEAGAIMIGHGTYPQVDDPDLPATLSRRLTTDLLRNAIGFDGVAISDDMEMHAVSDLGSYEEISERALMAGNDVDPLLQPHRARPRPAAAHRASGQRGCRVRARFEDAVQRAERYRAHCERIRAEALPPAKSFEEVLEEAVRFVEEFEKTRPAYDDYLGDDRRKYGRKPGTGQDRPRRVDLS